MGAYPPPGDDALPAPRWTTSQNRKADGHATIGGAIGRALTRVIKPVDASRGGVAGEQANPPNPQQHAGRRANFNEIKGG